MHLISFFTEPAFSVRPIAVEESDEELVSVFLEDFSECVAKYKDYVASTPRKVVSKRISGKRKGLEVPDENVQVESERDEGSSDESDED